MIRILKNFKWYYWLMLALMLLIIIGQVQLDLIVPDYMSQIVSLVTTPGSEMSEIWRVGLIMIACAFGSLVCTVLASFIAARMAAGFAELLRDKVFRKVESFSMNEINKFSTASLITRCTNDVPFPHPPALRPRSPLPTATGLPCQASRRRRACRPWPARACRHSCSSCPS